MERIDPQVAKRVWQRVQGDEMSVRSLLAAERRCHGAYRQLKRMLPGKSRSLQQLEESCGLRIRCLLGIDNLLTGVRTSELPLKPRQETAEGLLRHCYQQSASLAADYQRRGEHPEYGGVFTELAGQMRQQCMKLLEILGSMEKSTR